MPEPKKLVARKYEIRVNAGEEFSSVLLSDKRGNAEIINNVRRLPTEPEINTLCRAILMAENEWSFPWWQFNWRNKLEDFKMMSGVI
jgi:hypothetical protein